MAGTPVFKIFGYHYLQVRLTETSVGNATETEITLPVTCVRVLRHKAELSVAGSSATIDPMLSTASGSSTGEWEIVVENDTAAAIVDNAPDNAWFNGQADSVLYLQSTPDNAATDATVEHEIILEIEAVRR